MNQIQSYVLYPLDYIIQNHLNLEVKFVLYLVIQFIHPNKYKKSISILLLYYIIYRFATGGEVKRKAVQNFLDEIKDHITDITICSQDFETLHAINTMRDLYKPSSIYILYYI